MLKTLDKSTQTQATTAFTVNGTAIPMDRVKKFSAQCNVTVNTPANKTFASTAVDTTADTATITAHTYTTGQAVTLTTSGGLPAGLATSTTYYLIIVDANTVKFATSLANAKAGTAIDLTTQGTGTNTVVVTALATGTVQLQKSNDGVTWTADGSTVSVTATGTYWLEKVDPAAAFYCVAYALVSGSLKSSTVLFVSGEQA